jgi:hypothetical protein
MSEDRIKASMLLQVARFVEWPQQNPAGGDSFRVCVLSNERFLKLVQGAAQNERVHGRAVSTIRLNHIREIDACDVAYIQAAPERELQMLFDGRYAGPALTVSPIDEFASRGGMVGLVMSNGRIGLEINLAAGEKTGLRFSSKLLRLARVFRGED